MARQLDKIIVVDVEATCWESHPPPGQESEIIEIGVCLLDVRSTERTHKHSILVRPERSTVSPFCRDLTSLTQEMVAGGVSLAEACRLLRVEYAAGQRAWASFGDYDRKQFKRQCSAYNIPYPFHHTHINVKHLFALWQNLPQEVGLAEAAGRVNLPLQGSYHRGVDDAWNIAALLGMILQAARSGGSPFES